VIADNCSDRTAEIAREQNAIALERFDTVDIGKGYALEWALRQLLCAQADLPEKPKSVRPTTGGQPDPMAG